DVLAPEFTAIRPAHRLVELTRQRSAAHAPVAVVGVGITGRPARARIRNNGGATDVVSCTVEPGPPHRITETWLAGFVPAGLTPRLPMDFAAYPLPAGGGRGGNGGRTPPVGFSRVAGRGQR